MIPKMFANRGVTETLGALKNSVRLGPYQYRLQIFDWSRALITFKLSTNQILGIYAGATLFLLQIVKQSFLLKIYEGCPSCLKEWDPL